MSSIQPTEESFLKDVEKHEMKVLLDNGIYRHLRMKQPGSNNMWFDIVTWPGRLTYTRRYGNLRQPFARLEDMFEFFRAELDRRPQGWKDSNKPELPGREAGGGGSLWKGVRLQDVLTRQDEGTHVRITSRNGLRSVLSSFTSPARRGRGSGG